jgi:hypothetical protein
MMPYTINQEPRGKGYRNLILAAMRYCDAFLLVVRETINLDRIGENVLDSLEPFMREKVKSSRWPGTILLEDEVFTKNVAGVYYFTLCARSAEILTNSVDGPL